MDKSELAVKCFLMGFNCAQAILSTYGAQFGLDEKQALRLACGLGAGMGRLSQTCGAVSGAYLVLGLKHGQDSPENKDAREKTYTLVREFDRRFREKNGTTVCAELVGAKLLSDHADYAQERTKTVCPQMVRDAAAVLEELLSQPDD